MDLFGKSSFKQKIAISFIIFAAIFGILAVFIMDYVWLFSLLGGCLSYVLLMIITFHSVRTKIMKKISEADAKKNLFSTNENNEIDDSTQQTTSAKNAKDSAKKDGKERLKFIDLSKASLGFELSFSMPRILAFLAMLLCFVLLVWFGLFFPIIYLFGVFLGVVFVVCFLLMRG